jgi:hypothetical protein
MGNYKKALSPLTNHILLILFFSLAVLSGCMDGGGPATGTDTGTTTATITSISLAASPANLAADGVSTSTITASVDSSVADGKTINFSISSGTGALSASSAATSGGKATVTYTAGTTPGIDTVSANADGVSKETTIQLNGVPNSFSLSLSQTSVKSDNSDSSTVTATVLDNNKVPVSGTQVTFTATGGMISSSTAITDENGEAPITFSSGTTEKKNQVVTIIASVTGHDSKQIPILVRGTELQLSTDRTGLEVNPSNPDASTATLAVTLEDAGQVPIYDALVSISLDAASTGAVTFDSGLTTYQNNTDVNGKIEVEVTGTIAGDAKVKVAALGATATQTYTVDVKGESFRIDSPTEDPDSLSTNTNLTITVNAPDQTYVLFSTTFGTLTGTNETGQTVKEPVSGGAASVRLRSTSAGVATVQASDFNDPSTKDLISVIISAPSSEASQIVLQANANVVAPSTSDLSNTVILTATVKNASDQVVGNAPVVFSIDNNTATGGGETISPAVVHTNAFGIATTTFTSGSLSSDSNGVIVRAGVVGTAIASNDMHIIIGGTAASIAIGSATHITSINNETAYQLPMSVLVADSNGNPMKNTIVNLKLWPTEYATGSNVVTHTGEYDNEDVNSNLIMDAGEDLNNDGQLTPPSSAAGSIPSKVTTDDNGVANFNLVYLKDSASWIKAKITASTLVLGTETRSVTEFWLLFLVADFTPIDSLGPSPYNP